MTEIQTCAACGENDFTPFLTCLDHSISNEKFDLKQCSNCGLVITSPRPEIGDLNRYYLSDVYTSHTSHPKNLVDRLYRFARTFTLKWKSSVVTQNTNPSNNKTLLDFGCGTGQFIESAARGGWQVAGVEPSHVARQNAPKDIQPAISKSIEGLAPEKTYSAITLWHVLEHVHDLDRVLQSLSTRLENDGTLFIAVPNHLSWDGKRYQSYWAGYDVPRHLWHFSQQSMERLLTKNNLRVTKIVPMRLDAIYVSILSEKYLSNGKLSIPKILKGVLNGIISNVKAHDTREYSSLIFIAKK